VKKEKKLYHHTVFPAPMRTENAIYYISSQWVTNMHEFKDACMPVMVFTWQVDDQTIMAMHHQSFN
jgi:hypothetical protein